MYRFSIGGGGKEGYDIPVSEIHTTGRNVLIGLNMSDIIKKYKVPRESPPPKHRKVPWPTPDTIIDLATYEKKYPKSLFNNGVTTKNEDYVGHVMKDAGDKIEVFGDHDYRFDIPKPKIIAVSRNVIVDIDFPEIFNYKVDGGAPLPTGEPVKTHRGRGDKKLTRSISDPVIRVLTFPLFMLILLHYAR